MKVCFFDIETSNLNPPFGWIICAVIQDLEGKTKVFRIDKYKTFKKEPWNDRELVEDLLDSLREYDVIVTYYGDRYDRKWISTLTVYYDLEPIGLKYHIDIYREIKRTFKLHNYKLKTLIDYLNSRELDEITEKTPIDSINYKKAVTGDRKGIDYVVDHCKRDVSALREIYLLVFKYVSGIRKQLW